MFNKLLGVVGVSSLLLAAPLTSATAADMPMKAPMPVPAASWTGCYISGGAGYGMSSLDQSGESFPGLVAATSVSTQSGRGWLGTVGAGCDYQVAQRWVIGLLGDYNFMNVHGGFAPGDLALGGDENESSAWSIGGRIGYLVTPSLMTYFSGGYTQAHFDHISLNALLLGVGGVADFIPSHTYSGWFLGGGTEYALNFDWLPVRGLFWRNEYRFSSYESADLGIFVTGTGAAVSALGCSPGGTVVTACGEHISPYTQTITSALVWRFNWTGR